MGLWTWDVNDISTEGWREEVDYRRNIMFVSTGSYTYPKHSQHLLVKLTLKENNDFHDFLHDVCMFVADTTKDEKDLASLADTQPAH